MTGHNTGGVSVVMAVYNGDRFLAEAVQSILGQAMRHFELIAVDDGSTDWSVPILEAFARCDARVKILRVRHGGAPKALNAGIKAARYDWIARTDSDDRMLPDRLERQLRFLGEHPGLDLACGNCHFINASGKRIGSSVRTIDVERGKRELRPSLFVELVHPTVMMRKAAVLSLGGYREDLPYAEDRELWGRFATAGYTIGHQAEFLEEYRLHGRSMTMGSAEVQHEMCCFIDHNVIRRLQGQPEVSLASFREWKKARPARDRIKEAIDFRALLAFKKASRHYGEGRYWKCALTLAAAVSLNPGHFVGRVLDRLQSREAAA